MAFIFMAFVVVMRAFVVLLLVMKQRSAWNVEIVELRVLVGKADIQAADSVLIRQVVSVAIVDRLTL